MLILIHPDAAAVSRRGAAIVASLIQGKPDAVIGLAAGATPLAMYADLVRRHLDFSGVTVFGLDEYLDLSPDHPGSCTRILRQNLIERVNLPPSRVHLLGACSDGDVLAACDAYEREIAAAGGVDLQILGLGVNGHIGFNEPGCSLAGRTHPVGLRANTRMINRPYFTTAQDVPTAAITMGVATILAARRIILLATGPAKAAAVAKAVEGSLTAMVPASALQLHPDAVMLLDEAAASALTLRADYDAEVAALMGRPGMAAYLGLDP
jgi:glucosamine-6-phosphate deaminase